MRIVHVRVNDPLTQKPIPVRLRITDLQGRYHAPLGRLGRFNSCRHGEGNLFLNDREFAYIDGTCEIPLPPGPLDIEITKGPEFIPLRQRIELGVGQIALRFTLERWTDQRQVGWFSGDVAAFAPDPQAALLEGAAEDLAIVNLLASEERESRYHPNTGEHKSWSIGFPHLAAFSGQQPALESTGHCVVVNTCNVSQQLGRLYLLNCHRVVHPLFANLDWSLEDWCHQCHRKGGLVVWPARHVVRLPHRVHGEGLAQLLLGNVDAIDLVPTFPQLWYGLLNLGYRLPLTPASGKANHWTPLGAWRVYADLSAERSSTYAGWIEAVRAGRVFATTGPILHLSVNGKRPGEQVSDCNTVQASIRVGGHAPFDTLDLIMNGVVVKRQEWATPVTTAEVEHQCDVSRASWIAAACRRRTGGARRAETLAHTSAVFIARDDQPMPVNETMLAPWLRYADIMLAWAGQEQNMPSPRQRDHFVHIFEETRRKLESRRTE